MDTITTPPAETVDPLAALKAFFAVLHARQFVVLTTFLVGLIGVALMFFFIPRTYQSASRVLIVADRDGRDPSVSSVDLPSVATSTAVLSRVLDDLNLPLTLPNLKKALKAKVSDRSSIMDITYQDVSPDRAIAVPNTVADELARYYASIATNRAEQDIDNLDTALADTRRRLDAVNTKLSLVTGEYPLLGAERPLDALATRLAELETERATAFATFTGDDAAARAVSPTSQALMSIARHERLASDPLYAQLLAAESKDATQLAVAKVTFSERYPGFQSLQHKVTGERADVRQEEQERFASPDAFSPSLAQSMLDSAKAAATVAGDRTRVQQFDSLIYATRASLRAYQRVNARIAWLKVQQSAAQADYLTLSGRRTAAVADRAQSLSLGSVVVVDRAVRADTTVVGIGRAHLAVIMTLIVALIAIGSAPVAEILDPRLRRAKQVESLYGTPLITTLGGVR